MGLTEQQTKYLKGGAVVVGVLVLMALAYRHWLSMYTVVFAVHGAAAAGTGLALTVTMATAPTAIDYGKLVGKKVVVTTKSLGKITSTVAAAALTAAGAGTITTAANAITAAAVYAPNDADTARVYI